MVLRRLAGLALAAIALWLLWGGIHTVNVIVSRGSPLSDALLSPPTSLLRILGTFIAVLGGLLAAGGKRFGAVLSLIGVAVFVLLAASMVLSGADSSLWMDEAVFSGILVVLTGLLFTLPRT
ncbi:MAG: hypothetical protein IE925_03765 [Rhodobacterales bacterium]|jgi:hypothetical protein|nr:hypothetical protein [Rhodobacterales bacterium]